DLTKAREFQEKAAALKADFLFFEDSPDKVMIDINRAMAATAQAKAPAGQQAKVSDQAKTGTPPAPKPPQGPELPPVPTAQAQKPTATPPKTPAPATAQAAKPVPPPASPSKDSEARALLRQGRDQFKQGKLEDASKTAGQAKLKGATWGLFEDNPDKLL